MSAQPTGHATDEAPDVIRTSWTTSQKYVRTFTAVEMAELAESLRCDATPDAIYDALDNGDWRAEETMHEMALTRYWFDSSDARVDDVDDLTEATR